FIGLELFRCSAKLFPILKSTTQCFIFHCNPPRARTMRVMQTLPQDVAFLVCLPFLYKCHRRLYHSGGLPCQALIAISPIRHLLDPAFLLSNPLSASTFQ